MRSLDTMFARTASLILAVGIVVAVLMMSLQRQASVPAVRTFAVVIADLMKRNETMRRDVQPEGPAPPQWRDRMLALSPGWRAFSSTLAARLGPGAQLEIRGSRAGPVVWTHLPGMTGWVSRQLDLPRPEFRGRLLAITSGLLAAVFLGAALLARQLTGPLRRLAGMADRFGAGEPPLEAPVRGPIEIRNVQRAFVRLWESLQTAEQEREALLAGVSHDLRAPVSRMRFALGLHGEDANPRLLEELERDLIELEQIAGQFVAYARANYEEQSALVELDAIVKTSVDAAAPAYASTIALAGAEAEVAAHAGSATCAGSALPAEVAASAGAAMPSIEWHGGASTPVALEAANVRRLADNLIENAVRHGKPPIRVHTEQTAVDVTIVVRDGGAGIRAEDQAAALQPFTRFTSDAAHGSGLGLAIVDRIARRHGGRVSMQQTPEGFEVRVTLAAPASHA